jgi:hypothetical protein
MAVPGQARDNPVRLCLDLPLPDFPSCLTKSLVSGMDGFARGPEIDFLRVSRSRIALSFSHSRSMFPKEGDFQPSKGMNRDFSQICGVRGNTVETVAPGF